MTETTAEAATAEAVPHPGRYEWPLGRITHRWTVTEKTDLVQMIDAKGGWPVKGTYLMMRHDSETDRECYFTGGAGHNDGWNTRIMSRDDYLWLSLSERRRKAELSNYTRSYMQGRLPTWTDLDR